MRNLVIPPFISAIADLAYESLYSQFFNPQDVLLSPHFTAYEFLRSDTATRLGVFNVPSDKAEYLDVLTHLTYLCHYVLEPLRAIVGVPLKITSGFRTPTVNEAVKGVKNSYHLYGRAADVQCSLGNNVLFTHASNFAANKLGVKVLKYNNFIHIQI